MSTSANISGEKTSGIFNDISDDIKNGVDYIASYRRDENSAPSPSNIIKVSDGGLIKVIR